MSLVMHLMHAFGTDSLSSLYSSYQLLITCFDTHCHGAVVFWRANTASGLDKFFKFSLCFLEVPSDSLSTPNAPYQRFNGFLPFLFAKVLFVFVFYDHC